jgi:hypothetical protein
MEDVGNVTRLACSAELDDLLYYNIVFDIMGRNAPTPGRKIDILRRNAFNPRYECENVG